jgi:hypothetical protein
MKDVAYPWPSPQIVDTLVQNSSGYFIYASTVIKFIDDKYSRPTERLEVIRNLRSTDSAPFAALDHLYTHILSGVPSRFHSTLSNILCVVSHLRMGPARIDRLLELPAGDAELILRPLHSVLSIPSDKPIVSAHHASFFEFIRDRQRSLSFHVDSGHRLNMVRTVLKAFSNDNQWIHNVQNPLAWYAP